MENSDTRSDTGAPPVHTLTSILYWSTKRGVAIGMAFQCFSFEFQQFLDLPEERKKQVFMQVIETEKKLGKVAFALDNYEKIEKAEKRKLLERAKRDKSSVNLVHAAFPVELESAVEDLLSQAKSTLDVAVKILYPIFGIRLKTFGDSGDQVIRALDRQVPKGKAERTKVLIEHIKSSKQWLEVLRKYRTDIQHFSNIRLVPLRVSKKGDDFIYLPPLMPHGQDLFEFLSILYENLFTFLQDFFALSQQAAMYGGLGVIVTEGEGMTRKYAVGILKSAIRENPMPEKSSK